MSRRSSLVAALVLSWAAAQPVTLTAQTPTTPISASPAAAAKDVASAEAIVAALYDALSGTATQQRDWDRFRSLFIPEGRVMPTGVPQSGKARIRVMTPEEYSRVAAPQLTTEGFYEREVARVTESFGTIVHVFSTYESRHAPADTKPFARGINSFQLFNDGSRWWIVSVLWDRERPGNPLPAKYLPSSGRE
jgi:hypothetical protein